jgi:hypothetical protein
MEPWPVPEAALHARAMGAGCKADCHLVATGSRQSAREVSCMTAAAQGAKRSKDGATLFVGDGHLFACFLLASRSQQGMAHGQRPS